MKPRVLAIVPARGGSKGVPNKNLRPLAGQSLIAYAAAVAKASGVVDRVLLSTDTDAIAEEGRRVGIEVPFLRPPELATDDAPMLPVVQHAVATIEASGWMPDIVMLLQPTSPLRTPEHLRRAVDLLQEDEGVDSVVSVLEVPRHLSPDYVMRIDGGALVPFLAEGYRTTRRQDVRPAYVRDGSVYAFWRRTLVEHGSIYGAQCRPLVLQPSESVTIDSADDWDAAERMLQRRPA